MKKLLTLAAVALLGASANAQTITLKAEVSDETRELAFATLDTTKVYIDWGDGVISDSCVCFPYDGYNVVSVTGTVKGEGNIKIYGNGITNFEATSKVTGPSITSIDLSSAKDLRIIELNGNIHLTEIDVTPCTELTKLNLINDPVATLDLTKCPNLKNLEVNGTASTPCALSSIDLSKNTELTSLKLNFNNLAALDLTNNTKLTQIYALNNKIESLVLPSELPGCKYLSVNNNLLTSFDGSSFTLMSKTVGNIFLTNNNITSVANVKAKSVNVSNNKLMISTLPDATNIGTLTYAPQKTVEVASAMSTALDISSEYAEGNPTYTLYVGT
ncbi:MAG: hypothetical protein IKR18_11760, partial [Bacteroidaceae bacterium]|nr:hypothetical protein [Bacteroidaceae bacterium]